jgi:hypothetical protein
MEPASITSYILHHTSYFIPLQQQNLLNLLHNAYK